MIEELIECYKNSWLATKIILPLLLILLLTGNYAAFAFVLGVSGCALALLYITGIIKDLFIYNSYSPFYKVNHFLNRPIRIVMDKNKNYYVQIRIGVFGTWNTIKFSFCSDGSSKNAVEALDRIKELKSVYNIRKNKNKNVKEIQIIKPNV